LGLPKSPRYTRPNASAHARANFNKVPSHYYPTAHSGAWTDIFRHIVGIVEEGIQSPIGQLSHARSGIL